ncbi:MAG: CRISPR-associated protein Cas4 [Methanobacteriota archaeon]
MAKKVKQTKKTHHIPLGKITYTDLNIPAQPLFSKRYKLTGKPDYIVKKDNHYIPVERKSGSSSTPHRNHILQLAAYCQLLEDTYGGFVPYGILVYNNTQYPISFTPKLRFELESVITTMRTALQREIISLNHNDPWRCKACSMRTVCPNKLI